VVYAVRSSLICIVIIGTRTHTTILLIMLCGFVLLVIVEGILFSQRGSGIEQV